MARGSTRRLSPWDAAVLDLQAAGTRYRLRRVTNSPYIYVRDWAPTGSGKREWSLKPLKQDSAEDIAAAVALIQEMGNGPWSPPAASGGALGVEVPGWPEIEIVCQQEWSRRMKASTTRHYLADLAGLKRLDVGRTEADLQQWLLEKTPGSRPFLTRVECLSQIRKALTTADPGNRAPGWIGDSWLRAMRELHGSRRAKRVADVNGIRGIPTQQEAEQYLDRIGHEFPLEQWCLAVQFCYGLRNHELWWCSPITEGSEGVLPGWVLVPGWWRTKSKEEHWVWPVFPEWIERYKLGERLAECQAILHRRKRPKLVSALDQDKPWRPGNPADPGLCINNHYLGEFVSRQLRTILPPWLARVPDTDGRYRGTEPPVPIAPYDLRHAWAVTVATSPRWRHVRDEDAARAMGHDVEIHRRRYQRWIGADQKRRRAMEAVGGQPLPRLMA
jgi:hypothetical protein